MKEVEIVVIGTGGLGRETMQVLEDINDSSISKKKYKILGFLDDGRDDIGTIINGYKLLGNSNWLENHPDVHYVIGIGTPKIKKKLSENIKNEAETIIHPTAVIGKEVSFGRGCVVTTGCILTVNIKIQQKTGICYLGMCEKLGKNGLSDI